MSSLRKYSQNRGAVLSNGRWHSSLRGTPIYETWRGMKKRCLCPGHTAYHNYGGRGIRVCRALRDSPLAIIDCIGDRPPEMTLDRKNNDGHYSCGRCIHCKERGWPMNIRWATKAEQNRNSRSSLIVKINGMSLPACDWADRLRMPRAVFYQRIYAGRNGVELTAPVRKRRA